MSNENAPTTERQATVDQIMGQRREKRLRLIEAGLRPYGERVEKSMSLGDVHSNFESVVGKEGEVPEGTPSLRLVGRLMTRRDIGKLCFAHIHDHSGKFQLKLNKQEIGPEKYKAFIKDADIGDIIRADGTLTRTKTGELSLQPTEVAVISKAIRPWPEKYHGLTDVETRSRQRELDLATNEDSRKRFLFRSKLVQTVRQVLSEKGFIEVETPMMQAVPGGAAAKPFITHHEALDLNLYLRIAPELFLKRLLVGGFEKVFEIGRAFRNEGIDTRHNPEFTILEAYQAFADVTDMMDLAESLILRSAEVLGVKESTYRGEKCDLTRPFARASLVDLFKDRLNLDLIAVASENAWRSAAERCGLNVPKNAPDRKCFDLMFDERILPHLDRPTFVLDYPTAFSPLAKAKPEEPLLTDRFELFVAKEEVANAYTEQNDPEEQRRKFREELAKRQSGDDEAMPVDEDFLTALEYGMPPAGGLGIGIDRLTMILTNSDSIREVILFPLLRPQT